MQEFKERITKLVTPLAQEVNKVVDDIDKTTKNFEKNVINAGLFNKYKNELTDEQINIIDSHIAAIVEENKKYSIIASYFKIQSKQLDLLSKRLSKVINYSMHKRIGRTPEEVAALKADILKRGEKFTSNVHVLFNGNNSEKEQEMAEKLKNKIVDDLVDQLTGSK